MKRTLINGLFISTLLLMPLGLMGMTTGTGNQTTTNNTTTTVPSQNDHMTDHGTMRFKDHTNNGMSKDHMTQPGVQSNKGSEQMTTVGWRHWGGGPRYYGGYYGYGYYPRGYYYYSPYYYYYPYYGYGYGPYVYVG